MSDYQRITSYLYEYHNGIRGENIGFIRVETRDHQIKVSFTLNTSRLLSPIRLYFYYYEQGKMYGIPWDEINQTTLRFEYKESFHIDSIFHGPKSLNDMDGILFYYNDQQFYGSQWNETPINIHAFHTADREEPPQEPQLEEYMEALSLHEQPEDNKQETVSREPKTYPQLDPYPTPDYSSCMKIRLDDIADFPFIPQELGGNGFLKMQFQNYGHLFLGEKKLTNCHYIGVPGIFTNQRNFVAHLFGFPEFVPVPFQEQKTGNFGYWVMTIDH
ncbi:MAG TPA: hypothetical protein IAC33_11055 [Candidatus Fimousia stercorigallinarum]|nr:hypothetical protein [Candidatus Fimousia stercorigallinarum]